MFLQKDSNTTNFYGKDQHQHLTTAKALNKQLCIVYFYQQQTVRTKMLNQGLPVIEQVHFQVCMAGVTQMMVTTKCHIKFCYCKYTMYTVMK